MKKITLHLKIPSLNVLLVSHWTRRRGIKRLWAQAMLPYKGLLKGQIFKKVKIISYRKRLLDEDNLWGGGKSCVLDNIKDYGWIKDDSPDKVKIEYKQIKSKNERTEIILA